jgi:hypothetical protein
VPAVDHQMRDRDVFLAEIREGDVFLAEIREWLLQAQTCMKKVHDADHCDMEFAPGDWVWLRLNQRATLSVRDEAQSKLVPRFFRLYQVLGKIKPLAYKLQLPLKARIHNVFHVAFLKKFVGTPPRWTLVLPHIVRGGAVPQPEQVTRAHPTSNSWDVLVKWHDQPAGEAT